MKKIIILIILSVSSVQSQTDHVLCNTTAVPPFTVKSGAPFTVEWIMDDIALEEGNQVPNRYNGFYIQIDSGPKEDIGMAKANPACSSASKRPGDIPYTHVTKTGVSRGSHTLSISAWSFKLDGAGNPTTNRQESPPIAVPFSGDDPLLVGPPMSPSNVLIRQ